MRAYKSVLLFFVAIHLTGCAYFKTNYISPVSTARIHHAPPTTRQVSIFDKGNVLERSVSIGDNIFRIKKYTIGLFEYVAVKQPFNESYPDSKPWMLTHEYRRDDKSYSVVTHEDFYDGNIGVVLDGAGKIAIYAPFVQIDGARKGRSWPTLEENSVGMPFFKESIHLAESWGLRYSGKINNDYVFDIFNYPDSTKSTVLQTIAIPEQKFLSGFVVRGVFIKGLQVDTQGVIKCLFEDKIPDNSKSDSGLIDPKQEYKSLPGSSI